MESLLDPSYGLRVVAARYIGAYFPLVISSHFHYDVRSRIFRLAFRVASRLWCSESYFQVGVQSHHLLFVTIFKAFILLSSTFKAVFLIWCSELYLLSLGVESHHLLQFGHSEPPSLLRSVWAYQATISSQFGRSEPPSSQFGCSKSLSLLNSIWAFRVASSQFGRSEQPSLLNFGVQSHHLLSVTIFKAFILLGLAFRAAFPVWHLELRLLSLGVQSHHISSVWTFRATIFSVWVFRATISSPFSLGVQSCHLHSVRVFKATISSQFGHSKPPYLLNYGVQIHLFSSLAFGVASPVWLSELHLQSGVHSCIFSLALKAASLVCRSEPSSYHDRAFIATFSMFRATFLAFGAIVHIQTFKAVVHIQAFKAIISPQFGTQSRRSQSSIQSHHIFSLAFRAITQPCIQSHHFPLVWRSGPHSQHLEFLAFRVVFPF